MSRKHYGMFWSSYRTFVKFCGVLHSVEYVVLVTADLVVMSQ